MKHAYLLIKSSTRVCCEVNVSEGKCRGLIGKLNWILNWLRSVCLCAAGLFLDKKHADPIRVNKYGTIGLQMSCNSTSG